MKRQFNMQWGTAQCSAVKYSGLQCSVEEYCEEVRSAVWWAQCSEVQ